HFDGTPTPGVLAEIAQNTLMAPPDSMEETCRILESNDDIAAVILEDRRWHGVAAMGSRKSLPSFRCGQWIVQQRRCEDSRAPNWRPLGCESQFDGANCTGFLT
ncbi:MAG: hypothetical protein AAF202_12315, partial [Pseudomonadota bacterium]